MRIARRAAGREEAFGTGWPRLGVRRSGWRSVASSRRPGARAGRFVRVEQPRRAPRSLRAGAPGAEIGDLGRGGEGAGAEVSSGRRVAEVGEVVASGPGLCGPSAPKAGDSSRRFAVSGPDAPRALPKDRGGKTSSTTSASASTGRAGGLQALGGPNETIFPLALVQTRGRRLGARCGTGGSALRTARSSPRGAPRDAVASADSQKRARHG